MDLFYVLQLTFIKQSQQTNKTKIFAINQFYNIKTFM